MAFTYTGLLLNLYTFEPLYIFGCGWGFGFEQKFWRINGFGKKGMDPRICIPLFTPLYIGTDISEHIFAPNGDYCLYMYIRKLTHTPHTF